VVAVVATRRHPTTLVDACATTATVLGDLQVALTHALAARVKAAGQPAGVALGLEASADQLEAAVREMRRTLARIRMEPG
jgi:hypothetical protein